MPGRRAVLALLVAGTALGGLASAAFFFAKTLRPGPQALDALEVPLPVSELVPGQPRSVATPNGTILLLRPTAAQWQAVRRLDGEVWDRSMANWHPEIDAFAYLGADTGFGCPLRDVPPGQSTLVLFGSDDAATGQPVWVGGYASECFRESYDHAGRTIRTRRFSFNGFNVSSPNLKPVIVRRHGARFYGLVIPNR